MPVLNNTRVTYTTPYQDAEHPLVALINQAQKKIRLADYSFNDPAVTQALINAKNRGVDVQCIFDKSQSQGKTEIPLIERLKAAAVPLVIGESIDHKIIHVKFVVVDDEWTASGSYNFTVVAEQEDNFMDVEHDSDRAAVFTQFWANILDGINKKGQSNVN